MARVVVLGHDASNRLTWREWLRDAGHDAQATADAAAVTQLWAPARADIAVVDADGDEAQRATVLAGLQGEHATAAVILITSTAAASVPAGVAECLTKPLERLHLVRAVTHVARIRELEDEHRRLAQTHDDYREQLESLADERASELHKVREQARVAMEDTAHAMAALAESRNGSAPGHLGRVADLSRAVAKEMRLTADRVWAAYIAGIVHDIGTISVPMEILGKPGPLTVEEYARVQRHSDIGHAILSRIHFDQPIAEIVRQHHERQDGSGYPRGIAGVQILPEASIVGLADVVDAMCSVRPYRPALGLGAALDEIQQQRGVRYAPAVVDACLALFRGRRFWFD